MSSVKHRRKFKIMAFILVAMLIFWLVPTNLAFGEETPPDATLEALQAAADEANAALVVALAAAGDANAALVTAQAAADEANAALANAVEGDDMEALQAAAAGANAALVAAQAVVDDANAALANAVEGDDLGALQLAIDEANAALVVAQTVVDDANAALANAVEGDDLEALQAAADEANAALVAAQAAADEANAALVAAQAAADEANAALAAYLESMVEPVVEGAMIIFDPSISTDKADYGPGETVVITGTGFLPETAYTIVVERPDGSIVVGDGSFTPGSDTVTSNAEGNFTYHYVLNGISGTYLVDAVDSEGNVVASTTFTDQTDPPVGGDFSIDYCAPTASTYDHSTGGGQYADNVQQLNGGDFAVGEQVSFFDAITVTGTFEGSATIHVVNKLGNISNNNKDVGFDAYDEVIINPDLWNIVGGSFNEIVTVTRAEPDGDYFVIEYDLSGLETGERIVIRKDGILYNDSGYPHPMSVPTRLDSAYVKYSDGTPDDTINTGDQTVVLKNAELLATGSLFVYKFNDLNGNGVWDSGEPALENWEMTLTPGPVVQYTDSGGMTAFTALNSGESYTVTETLQSGWINTTAVAQGVIMPADGSDASLEFGNQGDLEISGTKYEDNNADGNLDAGELGLENWTITLTGTTDTGRSINVQTTTASDGSYSFSNLEPGDYTVTETLIGGWTNSSPLSIDINGLAADSTGNDFFNYRDASITVYKFNDLNGDGIWDTGEPALENWEMTLTPGSVVQYTDSSGETVFSSLISGYYEVAETVEPGWTNTTPTSDSTTLASGGSDTFYFGNQGELEISGTKYEDLNADGDWDAGELGLENWTITLTGTTDTGRSINVQTTTASDGSYSFSNLEPGDYTVTETLIGGWTNSSPLSIDINGLAADSTGNDFFNYRDGSITVYKFNDLNGDGIWDTGEPALENWEMTLTPGSVVQYTDSSGETVFSSLIPGYYEVAETVESGWTNTTPTSDSTTLASGGSDTFYFGNQGELEISGTKYEDNNADGNLDAGELGLENWTITLTGTTDTGRSINVQTTTASDGSYSFSNLEPGDYTVTETLIGGWTNSSPLSIDINGLAADSTGNDFFNYRDGSISGYKYGDTDNDVSTIADWYPIAGWIIELWMDGNGATAGTYSYYGQTTTDSNGYYFFGNLVPAWYKVVEQVQTGWTALTDTFRELFLGSGEISEDNNFVNTGELEISGTKYEDNNADGNLDAGELGLENWTITLTGTTDTGRSINVQTTTASDGSYSFSNLEPGDYTVTETLIGGWTNSSPLSIDINGLAADSTGNDFFNYRDGSITVYKFNDLDGDGIWDTGEPALENWEMTLTPGSVVQYTDSSGETVFSSLIPGYYEVAETVESGWTNTTPTSDSTTLASGGSGTFYFGNQGDLEISGTKYEDNNADGGWDAGELGLENWTITLTGTTDTGRSINVQTTTASDGSYSFSNLEPGDYTVTETLIGGWTNSSPLSIDINGLAADSTGNDFFNYRDGSITVYKFNDLDGDGIWDTGEPLLDGWEMTVDGTTQTTGSNGTGTTIFTGLAPGDYTVTEALKAGWAKTYEVPSGGAVTLQSGGSETVTFGNYLPPVILGSIGDYIWRDVNRNGVWDPGEFGLAGVTVYLYGPVNLVTETNASGFYLFSNLPPGTYTVVIDLDDPDIPGGSSLTTVGTHTVALSGGVLILWADFGLMSGTPPPTITVLALTGSNMIYYIAGFLLILIAGIGSIFYTRMLRRRKK